MPMICKSKRVAIDNTGAKKLFDADRTRRHVMLFADSTGANLFIGGSNVGDPNGFIVKPNTTLPIPAPACEAEMWVHYNQSGIMEMGVLEFCED